MRSEKGNREYEEHEEDVSNSNRDGPSSNTSNTTATGNTKDKNNDKANAIRSKHSVTEQRRRSKINERFQILRDLVPHGDQKRDTASFLLEVIDYVKHLQEKVQKYEGSYPGWSLEPAKLMPWRNTHWHVQTFAGQSHATKSGPGPVSTFPGKFEENNAGVTSNVLASAENAADAGQEVVNKSIDLSMLAPIQTDDMIVHHRERPAGSDLASTAGPLTENLLNQSEDLSIEGGTISISSIYSQGENIWLKPLRIGQMVQGADRVVLTHLWFRSQYLIQGVLAESFLMAPIHGLVRLLNTLTDALQSAGVDLSQASISVQIDLGKCANRGHMTGTSIAADQAGSFPSNSTVAHTADAASREEGSDQAQKRQKT